MIARTAIAALAVVAAGAGLRADADARPFASRIVDRTLSCPVGLSGGLYQVEARAAQGIKDGSRWRQLPFALVASGSVGSRANALDDSLAWITAGEPHAGTTIDTDFRTTPVLVPGTLALRSTCRAAKHVAFSSRGLQGGAASPFGDEYDCTVPRRVLVRVRAILRTPASLTTREQLRRTKATVREARLGVLTLAGKPLVYADVDESGRSRLFVASSCTPD